MRLFYALWPDAATVAALQALQARVHGRHVAPQNLHLTLAFLGEQPPAQLPLLHAILAQLPRTEFVLRLDRLGYFSKQRIVWAGSHETPAALHALQETLAQALDRHGIAWDHRLTFKPHITLARNAGMQQDLPFEPIFWQAGAAVLAHSQQGVQPSYRLLPPA